MIPKRTLYSQDIDYGNRLIYRVCEHPKIIFIISIDGHDLDESKINTMFHSDTDSNNDVKPNNPYLTVKW